VKLPGIIAELDPVVRLLEKDQPRLLVVVGTGVSIGATSASHVSWLGLLRHGVKHLVDIDLLTTSRGRALTASLETAFSPFDLNMALTHAENVENNLKTPDATAFAKWLDLAFADLRVEKGKAQTLKALRDLQQAGALLLTTNYDSLLSDMTGLPPVTWEEHKKLPQVINRRHPGVLHVHGHWQRPSSVVLGRSSYQKVINDRLFQDAFKSLWLEWTWLYVGFGNGLGDPNLGRLLEWGRAWKTGALPHYFLTSKRKAGARVKEPEHPPNLITVGYADHSDLPALLGALLPAACAWPFIPVDEGFPHYRNPSSSPLTVPFPSRKEYLDGQVPALSVDEEVHRRLTEYGWAVVYDAASVGKTTLALRMANTPKQRDHPTYYLDLASVDLSGFGENASVALRRLPRDGVLFVLDNAHHRPELARQLWDQWRSRPRGSRLLLLATRVARVVATTPGQDLAFFEYHPMNPALRVNVEPKDLKQIMRHIYLRVADAHALSLPNPPADVLEEWYRQYGHALGAFCVCVLARLDKLRREQWELPLDAASTWVQANWIRPLDAKSLENVVSLAVFGAQEIEIDVTDEALPNPDAVQKLLRSGLVVQSFAGQFGQYRRFRLREPGWGELILAAHATSVDREVILFGGASRHPLTAVVLSSRLRRAGLPDMNRRLWRHLACAGKSFVRKTSDLPLSYFALLVRGSVAGEERSLAVQCWKAIEKEPAKLAQRAWETPLGDVASFLDTAKRHKRDTDTLWEAIEKEPPKLAQRAWETPLGHLGSFLDTAERHNRDTDTLWEAIEKEPAKLAQRAWETPLGDVASFLDTAKRHNRDTDTLWEAIEKEPAKLAQRAWETPLDHLGSFLDTAKRHKRDTNTLWKAIEKEPAKLASRAHTTPIPQLAGFLRHAPDAVVRIALADFTTQYVAELASSGSMDGATWIAARCLEVERNELAEALLGALLYRADYRDFPPRGNGFANLAWLLNHAPSAASCHVPDFLDALCTRKWLGWQYTNASCGVLAAGLRIIALGQPPQVCERFRNPGLGIRLGKEFSEFAKSGQERRSEAVQLLGSASLFGWTVQLEGLAGLDPSMFAELPLLALPHRPEAEWVEHWQYQLWIGLRVIAFVTRRRLRVPPELIQQTMTLWQANLAYSEESALVAEFDVNQSMIDWLKICIQKGQGLIPLPLEERMTPGKPAPRSSG
jgi:hypothetical protein